MLHNMELKPGFTNIKTVGIVASPRTSHAHTVFKLNGSWTVYSVL